MNFEQIKGILERIVTVLITYAVAKGWFTQGVGAEIGTAVVAVLTAAIGWYLNRPSILAQAVTDTTPGTKIVTTAAVANALPNNPNVVSNTENKVVDK